MKKHIKSPKAAVAVKHGDAPAEKTPRKKIAAGDEEEESDLPSDDYEKPEEDEEAEIDEKKIRIEDDIDFEEELDLDDDDDYFSEDNL